MDAIYLLLKMRKLGRRLALGLLLRDILFEPNASQPHSSLAQLQRTARGHSVNAQQSAAGVYSSNAQPLPGLWKMIRTYHHVRQQELSYRTGQSTTKTAFIATHTPLNIIFHFNQSFGTNEAVYAISLSHRVPSVY